MRELDHADWWAGSANHYTNSPGCGTYALAVLPVALPRELRGLEVRRDGSYAVVAEQAGQSSAVAVAELTEQPVALDYVEVEEQHRRLATATNIADRRVAQAGSRGADRVLQDETGAQQLPPMTAAVAAAAAAEVAVAAVAIVLTGLGLVPEAVQERELEKEQRHHQQQPPEQRPGKVP